MSEMSKNNSNKRDSSSLGDIKKTFAEESLKSFPLLEQLDGQAIIQAVVMMELLGKPKAKRRKRGHFLNEGTHCR